MAAEFARKYGGTWAGLLTKSLAVLAGLELVTDLPNPMDIVTVGCLAINAASFGLGTGPGTQVTVSPPRAVVPLGGTQQFTATVAGPSDTSVTWSVVQGAMGGSITNTGLYTAPTTMPFLPEVTIDATSTADSQAVAQEGVTLVNSTGGSSGSMAIITGQVGGQTVDKAYIPVPNPGLISVVNVDASPASNAVLTTIQMPPGYSPNATAANPTTLEVVVGSYTSPDLQIIDAFSDQLVDTLTTPVTQSFSFSGGSCMICGIQIDPARNQAILDTAQGYLILDLSALTFSPFVAAQTAENFGYSPNQEIALSPFYDEFGFGVTPGVQAVNFSNNAVFNLSSNGVNWSRPDAAAVDLTTGVAVVADEDNGSQLLINLNAATFDSSASPPTFSAPSTLFSTSSPNCGSYNEWTMISVESSTHLLFLGTEYYDDCAGVETFPAASGSGVPPTPTIFNWGHVPSAPDGSGWQNATDPHGIAVFTSVVDGKAYGFLVRADAAWVAKVDLVGVASASQLSGGGQGQVDLTPFVTFYATQ